jgi:hypothetical protein
MTSDGSMLKAIASGVAFVGLCSVPALGSIAKRISKRDAKQDTYEDGDGKASPESLKAYSAKLPKAVVLASAVAGLGVSIALLIISPHAERRRVITDSLSTGAWVRHRGTASRLLFLTDSNNTRRLSCCFRLWPRLRAGVRSRPITWASTPSSRPRPSPACS